MLIHKKDNGFIWGHLTSISKEDAQPYIDGVNCIWVDDLVIEYPPHEDNQMVEMYLNEDNTIRYEIVDKPIDIKETTLDDVKKDIGSLQEDNLVVMGAQAEQYEGQQSMQKDVLALMSAVAELYEMVIGGSK